LCVKSARRGNQGGGGNTLFGSTFATSVFNGDYNGEKGNSSSDQRQRLVVNGILAPTFTKRSDWFSKNVINGWQLSVIQDQVNVPVPAGVVPTNCWTSASSHHKLHRQNFPTTQNI